MKNKVLIIGEHHPTILYLGRYLEELGYQYLIVEHNDHNTILATKAVRAVLLSIQNEVNDSIPIAKQIKEQFRIPCLFFARKISALQLQHLKTVPPPIYFFKPWCKRELLINLEIALYNHHKIGLAPNLGTAN